MKKLLWALIVFVIFESILILLIGQFMLFAEVKGAFTGELAIEAAKQQLLNPLETIQSYVNEKNPLFLLGTILLAVLSLYLVFSSNEKKTGWNVHERNAYHGSARWAREKELYADGNYKSVELKTIYKNLLDSIDGDGDNKN